MSRTEIGVVQCPLVKHGLFSGRKYQMRLVGAKGVVLESGDLFYSQLMPGYSSESSDAYVTFVQHLLDRGWQPYGGGGIPTAYRDGAQFCRTR